MPGLSQLKQFNKDMIAIGDETTLRAARGEHPVRVPIPKTIKDINDSNDFVLGMPENELEIEETPIDNDLSDIINPNAGNSEKAETADSGVVDLSSLLNPMGDMGGDSSGDEMPDLSAFMDDPIVEEEPVVEEPEPEPVSIADMGLEALLSGTGFDGSDINELEDTGYVSKVNSDEFYTDEELEEIAPPERISKNEKHVGNLNFDDIDEIPGVTKDNYQSAATSKSGVSAAEQQILSELANIPGLDLSDLGITNTSDSNSAANDFDDVNLEDIGLGDVLSDDGGASEEFLETFDEPEDANELEESNEPEESNELEDAGEQTSSNPYEFEKIDISVFPDSDPTHVAEPLNDFDYPDENAVYEEPSTPKDSSEIDDILSNIEEVETPKSEFDDLDLDNIEDIGIDVDSLENGQNTDADNLLDDVESIENLENIENLEGLDAATDFDVMDFEEVPLEAVDNEDVPLTADLDEFDNLEETVENESLDADGLENLDFLEGLDDGLEPLEDVSDSSDENTEFANETLESLDDLGDLGEFGNLGDLDSPDENVDSLEQSSEAVNIDSEDLKDGLESLNDGLETLDDLGDLGDLNLDSSESTSDENTDDLFSAGLDDIDSLSEAASEGPSIDDLFSSDDVSMPDFQDEIPDSSAMSDSTDIFASGLDDDVDSSASASSDSGDLFSDFDASELEGLDFSTGASSEDSDSSGNGFDLGDSDDFALEGSDFEIAGYTDVDIAKEEKKSPVILPTPDFSGAMEGSKLPPNTLSDEQYRQFTENLETYPLNVRLAFEDLIVRDEFTDDAEFEIIEKIINKVPARQLASTLEKMLDISLPVPRDFEHRTAAEYDAYKKSLQYQLRNKIIPGALIGILCLLIGFGIFQFVRNCIYIPAKAVSLYKQGYALLEADEYPQSEIKFNEAVKYRINKKWFFNYARGYRRHKQYQRAEDMYDNILKRFKHDKTAGLEYANMELQDIGNYPKAEEIVRRQVLDWHINDPDGILTLGDTFLEWATEKDPSKFDSARQQYATLINLYGSKPLYLSRMMRYFVRTDNLQQVLQLKTSFDNNKKYKYDADDITELSGYLLDKLYGTVTPAEEYLKNRIEGVRGLLLTAVRTNPQNPTAWYNLSRYYINTRETTSIERALQRTILEFNNADTLRARDIYNYIDSYRLLGEYYVDREDYLKAQEQYTEGLSLYTTERDNAGFAGTEKIGKLYSDLADINYFVSSEYKQALSNYEHAVDLNFDNPQIRYRIGYIQYRNRKFAEALSSFMKASEGNIRHKNLMLAMANTLSLRGDDYAASGYYESLIAILDDEIKDEGIVFPQANAKHYDLINNYLYASNNYGVTLHRLAVRTGDSALNADAIVQFQQSVRAWDALTRNQESMVRLDGSNLALENIRYITHPFSEYEPAIYTDIRKVLTDAEGIR